MRGLIDRLPEHIHFSMPNEKLFQVAILDDYLGANFGDVARHPG
jgi:hypothetical protein